MVTIALPNSVDWFVAVAATWKIGAIPQPVSPRLPTRELAAIVELADPRGGARHRSRHLRRSHLPAGRLRRSGDCPGCGAAARRHLARVEGADLGRLDRPSEAHRGRPAREHR